MSRAEPLVYVVSRAAAETAQRIIPGCVETEIANAISQGRVRNAKDRTFVISGNGWQAEAVRRPGAIRPRPRAWHVFRVRRAQPQRTERE